MGKNKASPLATGSGGIRQRRILLTGAAGFVGSHLARCLSAAGHSVLGVDNLNDYYDPELKVSRLMTLDDTPGFQFVKADIADTRTMTGLAEVHQPELIINLAAQVGVRNSLKDPGAYIRDNVVGFANILEIAVAHEVEQVIYASSSSVYGANTTTPYSSTQPADHPLNLYAATKRSNELMAHAYSSLYQLPTTGLRFFTVYGPWGRPDMAYFKFAKAITEGTPIDVYGDGQQLRDFTYVDDVVSALAALVEHPALPASGWDEQQIGVSSAPWQVLNVGCGQQTTLNRIIDLLEQHLGTEAKRNLFPSHMGDMRLTLADPSDLESRIGFAPQIEIDEGLERFVLWFKEHYLSSNTLTSELRAS